MSPVYEVTARRQDRVIYRVEAPTAADASERIWMDEGESLESENLDIDVLEVRGPDGKEDA